MIDSRLGLDDFLGNDDVIDHVNAPIPFQIIPLLYRSALPLLDARIRHCLAPTKGQDGLGVNQLARCMR